MSVDIEPVSIMASNSYYTRGRREGAHSRHVVCAFCDYRRRAGLSTGQVQRIPPVEIVSAILRRCACVFGPMLGENARQLILASSLMGAATRDVRAFRPRPGRARPGRGMLIPPLGPLQKASSSFSRQKVVSVLLVQSVSQSVLTPKNGPPAGTRACR